MIEDTVSAIAKIVQARLTSLSGAKLAGGFNVVRGDTKAVVKFKDAETGVKRIQEALAVGTVLERGNKLHAFVVETQVKVEDEELWDRFCSELDIAEAEAEDAREAEAKAARIAAGEEVEEPVAEVPVTVIKKPVPAPAKAPKPAASPKVSKATEASIRTEKVVTCLKEGEKHIDEISKQTGLSGLFVRNAIDAARRQKHTIVSVGKGVFRYVAPAA